MAIPNCGTDYSTPCGVMPMSFIQMLAACLINYPGCDIRGAETTFINVIGATDDCDDLTPFWNCANNHIDPERALVENAFALDDCGNLAIKFFNNQGTNIPEIPE